MVTTPLNLFGGPAGGASSPPATQPAGANANQTAGVEEETNAAGSGGALAPRAGAEASTPPAADDPAELARVREARSAFAENAFLADLEAVKAEAAASLASEEPAADEERLEDMRVALSRLEEVVAKYEESAQARAEATLEERRETRRSGRDSDDAAAAAARDEIATRKAVRGYETAQNSLEASRSLSGGFVNSTA